jgi:hypothetical protein
MIARRKFIQAASGVFVPVLVNLWLPKAHGQLVPPAGALKQHAPPTTAPPAQPDPPTWTRGDEVCGQFEWTLTTPAAYPSGATSWDIYININMGGEQLFVSNAGLSYGQAGGPDDADSILAWMRARNAGPSFTDSTQVLGP